MKNGVKERNCEWCGNKTMFERISEAEPPEGEVCGICERWICSDCVDWSQDTDEDIICVYCSGAIDE